MINLPSKYHQQVVSDNQEFGAYRAVLIHEKDTTAVGKITGVDNTMIRSYCVSRLMDPNFKRSFFSVTIEEAIHKHFFPRHP